MTPNYFYSNKELDKLTYLLGKYRFDKLSEEEYNELKDIITIYSPSAKNDEEIIKAGIITVGIYSLVRLLTYD